MTSRTTERFRKVFRKLPRHVQQQAREAYKLFQKNPQHPGLHFKRIHAVQPIYSVRIGLYYRAVGILEEGIIIWFWIGGHAEYDQLCSRL